MSKIAKISKHVALYDAYSNTLTNVQKETYKMYYFEDMSLSEIAKSRKISRAAVQDALKKTEAQLVSLEKKLGIVKRNNKQMKLIKKLETTKLTKEQNNIIKELKEN